MDRLSGLPEDLLLTVLSFLPTHIAARTSLLSRRFRHLWKASPSLELINIEDLPFPETINFVEMADRSLLNREPLHPLVSLHLDLCSCCYFRHLGTSTSSLLSLWLSKARSLGLRHLTIADICDSCFPPVFPVIFSITTLHSLSLGHLADPSHLGLEELNFPSGTTLTRLRSFSLTFFEADPVKLNQLLSELCSLEELHLNAYAMHGLKLSSKTIRKLKLIISEGYPKLHTVELFLPSLESFHLELLGYVSRISGAAPLLKKAIIVLDELRGEDVGLVAELLKFISHAEELSLRIKENREVKYPIQIMFEPGKDTMNFSNLKHLDVTACFHKHNIEAVVTMLHHSPALESLNLVHEVALLYYWEGERRKNDWESKLPRNPDGNDCQAHFRNLHLGENRKEFMKSISEEHSFKRKRT